MSAFTELAGKVITFLIPVLKSKSARKIGSDFSEAVNNEVLLLWKKIKPIFIEEIEEETEAFEINPDDKENQSFVEHELRKILKKDDELVSLINELIEKIESDKPGYIKKHNEIRIKGDGNIGIQNIGNSNISISSGLKNGLSNLD